TLVPRRSAPANAKAAAGSFAAEPSAARTTGPLLGLSGVRGGIRMTGRDARYATPAGGEPGEKASRAVSPRLPTTDGEAPRADWTGAPTGLSAITRNETSPS